MKRVASFILALVYLANANAQNVGIGTNKPTSKLTVASNSTPASPTLLLYGNQVTDSARMQFQNKSGTKFWQLSGYIDNATDANSRLTISHSVKGNVLSIGGDGNVGVGTPNPTAKLTIAGSLKLANGTQGAGKVLTSDAAGNASWSGSIAFAAQNSTGTNLPNNTTTVIVFGNQLFDDGGNYNSSNGRFVAPINGNYHFDATIRLITGVVPAFSRFLLCVNGVPAREVDPFGTFMQISTTVKLNANDYVDIRYFFNDRGGDQQVAAFIPLLNNFSGYLIK